MNYKVIIILAFATGLVCGCKKEEAKVDNISIKNPPFKSEYFAGESLRLEGLVVTLTMSNGSSKDVPFENFLNEGITTSPSDGFLLPSMFDKIEVKHTESNKTTYHSIVVTDVTLSRVEIKNAPIKTEYVEGEKLDLTGFSVTLVNNNGTTKEVGINDFTANGLKLSIKKDTVLNANITKEEVIHIASGIKAEQPLVVRHFFGMALKSIPNKQEYYKGEKLNIADLEIVIFIDNTDNQRILKINEFAKYGISTSIQNGEILNNFTTGPVNVDITHKESQKSTFITILFNEFLKDIDGNSYKIVRIKNRIWMAQNLKVTRYSDGTAIPLVQDNLAWANLADNNTARAYCYYNNNANNEATTYGAMYTYAAAVNSITPVTDNDTIQGACPDGWHVASYSDWRDIGGGIYNGSINLKAIGDEFWGVGNNGTDIYGFNALPGGYRRSDNGQFQYINEEIHWWSTTDAGNNRDARAYSMDKSDYFHFWSAQIKSKGLYVRCVKD